MGRYFCHPETGLSLVSSENFKSVQNEQNMIALRLTGQHREISKRRSTPAEPNSVRFDLGATADSNGVFVSNFNNSRKQVVNNNNVD